MKKRTLEVAGLVLLAGGCLLGAGWRKDPATAGKEIAASGMLFGGIFQARVFGRRLLTTRWRREHEVLMELLRVVASAVEVKNAADFHHISRVAGIAERLAIHCRLKHAEREGLRLACYVHDIGKLGIPAHTLHGQQPPSDREWDVIRNHSSIGAALLGGSGLDSEIIKTVRYHHENWDGTGYPEGLADCDIPVTARILAVADGCDALMNMRPYRGGFTLEETISILRKESGKKFDPRLVTKVIQLLGSGQIELSRTCTATTDQMAERCVVGEEVPNRKTMDEAVREIGASEAPAATAVTPVMERFHSIQGLMQDIQARVRPLAPYRTLVLYMLEEKTDTIRVCYADGDAAEKFKQISLVKGQGITGWAVANKQDICANHAEMDFPPDIQPVMPHFAFAAVFALEAKGESRVCPGALTLYMDRQDLFPQAARTQIRNLVRHVSWQLECLAKRADSYCTGESDPVTHLPTLNLLYSHAALEIAQARRHCYAVSLMEMELENYQDIVKQHGQDQAEEFMRELARAMRRFLRDGDLLARISESEFGGVFPMTAQAQLQFLLRRLKGGAEHFRFRTHGGAVIEPKLSFGMASYPEHGKTCESLFLRANTQRNVDKMQPKVSVAAMCGTQPGKIIPFRQ